MPDLCPPFGPEMRQSFSNDIRIMHCSFSGNDLRMEQHFAIRVVWAFPLRPELMRRSYELVQRGLRSIQVEIAPFCQVVQESVDGHLRTAIEIIFNMQNGIAQVAANHNPIRLQFP
jgi:hypothetical protein